MLTDKNTTDLTVFKQTLDAEWTNILDSVQTEAYEEAVQLIDHCCKNGGRLHITGIGKPSYVAGYIASLISSTGRACYLLHGTEAVHGSSGQVYPGDVVIAISNSGETAELQATAATLIKNGAKIIGVSGNKESWLAKNSHAFLYAGITSEGGPLNRAPRASIVAETVVLQGLTVLLQSMAEVSPEQYVSWHPGGALGKLRENEKAMETKIC